MLDLLDRHSSSFVGLGVSSSTSCSSDTFISLYLLSKYVLQKKKVVIVSSRLTETNYRFMCSKVAVRWDPTLVRLIELSSMVDADQLSMDKLIKSVSEHSPSLVIFDDCSTLEMYGVHSASIVSALHSISATTNGGLVFASFPVPTEVYSLLLHMSDFTISTENVGSGFGKDVTGKMSLSVRAGRTVPEQHELLYLVGERSMKCFFPGGAGVYF